MPIKKSEGNMYPWVTHTHTHLGGECPHKCLYCYIDNPRFGRPAKYTGEIRLLRDELAVRYGAGRTIFVEHMNDLFAAAVPDETIMEILGHCRQWPSNTYVFQTKNPERMAAFMGAMPSNLILGTTLETNRSTADIGKAPPPKSRYEAMLTLKERIHAHATASTAKIFITVEPILAFDLAELSAWLVALKPDFINIGADSKSHGLPEPSKAEVLALAASLRTNGLEIREKHNLHRLVA